MRTITMTLLWVFALNFVYANDIDSLKTNKDVQKFLEQKVDSEWKKYNLFETADKANTTTFGKGKFFKLDLDNNGLTDLVINGKYFFAVTDNGNGHYKIHFIDRGAFMLQKHTLTNIIYNDNTPLLIVARFNEYEWQHNEKSRPDTLVLKFGGFVEFNATPEHLKIEEIKFSTSGCYGTCPIFELAIMSDRSATYNAIEYNDKTGKFKTIIDTTSYNNFLQTVNYIKLTSLEEKYSVGWTDDQTVTLEIKYNNGQTKKISDYGAIGTFGLENLYNQFFSLRKTQQWK